MKLNIYNQSGELRITVSPTDNSTWKQELMGENILNLSFTLPRYISFSVNDYIELEGERYTLLNGYEPTQKSGQEYEYNPKFYGISGELKKALMLHTADGAMESSFSLHGNPAEHLAKVIENINRIKGGSAWTMGTVLEGENKNIEYRNKFCFDALNDIAAAFDTEWWVEGTTVNLCRCEHGDVVELGYGHGLVDLTKTENSADVKFVTRLFPIGSTKNIDRNKYGHSHLQLPDGALFVERNTQYGIYEDVEEEAFAGIYPRRTGKVGIVESEERKNEEGGSFTVYYFTDPELDFDPNNYEIGGLDKHIVFQSGNLNGRDFAVNFDSRTNKFEIINQCAEDGTQLPGSHMIPGKDDEYILYNISMPDEYYTHAEQEFKEAVDALLEKQSEDVSIYKGNTDYVYIGKQSIELTLGRRVRLLSDEYFKETGSRESRITSISRKLNNPGQMYIECSVAIGKGRADRMESDISKMKTVIAEQLDKDMFTILKTWDSMDMTNFNLLSSLRTLLEIKNRALSRVNDDTASGVITLLKGWDTEQFSQGSAGAGLYRDEEGNWHLESDYVTIHRKLTAEEIEVQKTSHIGGKLMQTAASMFCDRVEKGDTYYRCFFKSTDNEGRIIRNLFKVDDQALVETFNLSRQADGKTGNHYLWRLVTGTGDDYIDLSKDICAAESEAPLAGDTIVQLGYRGTDDVNRQNAQILSGAGDGSPYLKQFVGINTFALPPEETRLKPGDNLFTGKFISQATGEDLENRIGGLAVDMEAVKRQADNQYIIWFGNAVPTLTNYPVSDWEVDEYEDHVQDLFYLDNEVNEENNGRGFRFLKNEDGSFGWSEITDQYVLQCLKLATDAKTEANSKRRNFVLQPTIDDAYDAGDTWSNVYYKNADGSYLYENDNLVCKIAKKSGEVFNINHWKAISYATKSNIKIDVDKIVSTVRGGVDENAEAISGLDITVGALSATVQKISFDENNNIRNINTSGLVTSGEFANLFSQQVTSEGIVKRGDIGVFVERDEVGNLISQATIEADKINFVGKTTINGNFIIDEQGNMTVKNMKVTEGSMIAGLKISGNSLTNEGFNNDAYIILRNDYNKTFAGIGGNMLPISLGGIAAVARFENNRIVKNGSSSSSNIALMAEASGSEGNNIAIMVTKGRMDVPGLLMGMRISVSNNSLHIDYAYNLPKAYKVEFTGSVYIITHNLGHTRYLVNATPLCAGNRNTGATLFITVFDIQNNYFKLNIADSGQVNRDYNFQFIMIGDNR